MRCEWVRGSNLLKKLFSWFALPTSPALMSPRFVLHPVIVVKAFSPLGDNLDLSELGSALGDGNSTDEE